MTTKYLLADESGNFDFSRKNGATKYFAVGTFLTKASPPDSGWNVNSARPDTSSSTAASP